MKFIKNTIYIFSLMSVLFLLDVRKVEAIEGSVEFTNTKIEIVNESTVVIEWMTNVKTKGEVKFGKSENNLNAYIKDTRLSRSHKVELGNLQDNTKYYYKIYSHNSNEEVSTFVHEFKTDKRLDRVAPSLSNVKVASVLGTVVVFTWNTDELSSSWVEYGYIDVNGNDVYLRRIGSNNKTNEHVVSVGGLSPGAEYYAKVYSVDSEGNLSVMRRKEFKTLSSDRIDKQGLEISRFRPSGPSDGNIEAEKVVVGFKTNHFAHGSVSLKSSGFSTRTINLPYESDHRVEFLNLTPGRLYTVQVSMVDVFGKRASYLVNFQTLEEVKGSVVVKGVNNTQDRYSDGIFMDSGSYYGDGNVRHYTVEEVLSKKGFYGQYYNLSPSTPRLDEDYEYYNAKDSEWFIYKNRSFARVDIDLSQKSEFLPIGDRIYPGDPYYFSVYWRAVVFMKKSGYFDYYIGVDNSGWVYIDGMMVTSMGSRLPFQSDNRSVYLEEGYHTLEIMFAERGPSLSKFTFVPEGDFDIYPWYPGFDVNRFTQEENKVVISNKVQVKGVEYSRYTRASRLLKTKESPAVYAVLNGKRHYISSPASFAEYGYKWSDVEIVSKEELYSYPRVRLVKTPDVATVNYLYQRPEEKWMKIDLNSPTVFVSYEGNYWGDIVVINEHDMGSYPEIKLVTTANSERVYYLEGGFRREISDEKFLEKNFNKYEVTTLNDIHMSSYRLGEMYK